jgi:hypothetical protein
MGYRGGLLADFAPALDRGIDRFARRTTEKVGEELRKRVRRHTPVAKAGVAERASYGSSAAWVTARGRLPGTLKESWQVGEVEVLAGGVRLRVPVYTMDPVAPHVEWDTMPHLIAPKKPGGVLTVPTKGGMVFARLVHHPGTRGQHMMATAIAEVAIEWQRIADREWNREARGFFRRNAA